MNEDLAKLLLRLGIGGLMLFHGVDKLLHGVEFIEGMLSRHDLPDFVTYGVYLAEVVAPLLLIVGLFTSLAALVIVANMVIAILLVHASHILSLTPHGGWSIEVPMLYLIAALTIALFGAGKYSLDHYLHVR